MVKPVWGKESDEVFYRNSIKRFVDLDDISRLVDLATYRGSRHKKKLPVRGQRTKTNARIFRRRT